MVTAPSPIGVAGPLGLLGFGVVTFLSAATKFAGSRAKGETLIIGVGLLIGGLLQLVAGFLQYAKNNTHSATAFVFFGSFWMSQAIITILEKVSAFAVIGEYKALAFVYYMILSVVTFILFVPTLRMNRVLSITFAAVIFLYIFDAVGLFTRVGEILSGVSGVIAAVLAFYLAAVDLWNDAFAKQILPVWPHGLHKADFAKSKGEYIPRFHFHKSSTGDPHV